MSKRTRPRQHKRRLPSGKTVTVNKGVRKKRRVTHTASGERFAQNVLKGGLPAGSWVTDDPRYEKLFAEELEEGDRYPVKGGVLTVDLDLDDADLERAGRHFRTKKPIPLRDKNIRPPKTRERRGEPKYLLIARTGKVLGNQKGYDTPDEALKHPASISPYTFIKKYYPKED